MHLCVKFCLPLANDFIHFSTAIGYSSRSFDYWGDRMEKIIINILDFFTDIPYNIWPWLLLLSAPLLIFSARPHHSAWKRFWRIALAVGIGYALLNLSYHTNYFIGWHAFEACQSQFSDGALQNHKECGKPPRGIPLAFMAVLGWIPAGAYVGLWEFWWRRKYRFIIGPLGNRYKGKWFSTTLIVCSVPVWILVVLLLITIFLKFADKFLG